MALKYSPLAVFEDSDTPLALHVRQRYMGGSSRDERVAGALRERIASAQRADGSWGGSVAETIGNLFSLWLLGAADAGTQRAVNWLMETDRPPLRCICNDGGSYDDMFFRMTAGGDRDRLRKLRGMPFTPGCAGFVKTGAALFHALELGQGDKGRISRVCETISRLFSYRKRLPCTGSCSMNLLLAMSADAGRFDGKAIRIALASMQRQQDAGGRWGKSIPFFEAVYVLSRLPEKLVGAQLERALRHVVKSQQRSGGWGRTDRQLKAFLLLPALRQAALLDG